MELRFLLVTPIVITVMHNNNSNSNEEVPHKENTSEKTRLMGVLLTTSSVLFPEDYSNSSTPNATQNSYNNINSSNSNNNSNNNNNNANDEEVLTFLEEPIAGTAARLGFTPSPVSLRLRRDYGFVTSLTDDDVRREEKRRRNRFNNAHFINDNTNRYGWSNSTLPLSTLSSDESTNNSNNQYHTYSTQSSPILNLSKSNNEADMQFDSVNLNSFIASHLNKKRSNNSLKRESRRDGNVNDDKDHPLSISEEQQQHEQAHWPTHEKMNKSSTIVMNESHCRDGVKEEEEEEEEKEEAVIVGTSPKANSCECDQYAERCDCNSRTGNGDDSNKNNKIYLYDVKENATERSSASDVLLNTHATAPPANSTCNNTNTNNNEDNNNTTIDANQSNMLKFNNVSDNSNNNNNNYNLNRCDNGGGVDDAHVDNTYSLNKFNQTMNDDDGNDGEIVGYCITYCDLTPFVPSETNQVEDAMRNDVLSESQICNAITPLPLPLLLSEIKTIEMGDVHMIITYVDYSNNHNNKAISSKAGKSTNTSETKKSSASSALLVNGSSVRWHKLCKVSYVCEHYCEYELVKSSDNLHWCSGGAVFDCNGCFIGLHHQEIQGRCMCIFTTSIVRHLFVNNLLGLCNSPISSLTRVQVSNGEVQSESDTENDVYKDFSDDNEENYKRQDLREEWECENERELRRRHRKLLFGKYETTYESTSSAIREGNDINDNKVRLGNLRNTNARYKRNNDIIGSNSAAEISLNDAFMMCSNNGKQLVDFNTFQRMRAHHQCVTATRPPSFEEVYDEYYSDFHSIPHMLYAFPHSPPLIIKALTELVKPTHNTEANMEFIA